MNTVPSTLNVVRHESAIGCWEMITRAPDPRLAPFLHGMITGYRESTHSPLRRLEAPHPGVVVIINFGERYLVSDAYDASYSTAYGSFVAGLHDTYVFVEAIGPAYCMQVNLSPIAAGRLLDMPACEIANRTIAVEDLFGNAAGLLVERLAEAPTWEARFDMLERSLLNRLLITTPPHSAIEWAWQRIRESRGSISIGTLADELGWSRKHLAERFRLTVGMTPKALARIVRFDALMMRLRSDGSTPWTSLALDCGYFDQSHMIRDFSEFVGCTPGEYLQRLLPDGGGVIA